MMVTQVNGSDIRIEEFAGLTPAGNLIHRPKHYRAQHSANRVIGPNHVLPPTSDPHFPAFTSDEKTAILISAAGHRVLSVGSSALSRVGCKCNRQVKHSPWFRPAVSRS